MQVPKSVKSGPARRCAEKISGRWVTSRKFFHPSATPTSENVTVDHKKQVQAARDAGRRPRPYLTEDEIETLIEAAKHNRQGHRDATAILIAYRHGLRSNELVTIRWDDFDFRTGKLHVRRSKGGEVTVHPIGGREMRALKRLQREQLAATQCVSE
jgi:type 1 fimbriae regulatory protein FimB/type 1 fimbriae regulatory protein FimE